MPDTLRVLPITPQIKGLHTYIRNRDTPRDEFIFYSKRLIRLVIEYSLSLLPYQTVTVETPQDQPYEGKKCTASKICGSVATSQSVPPLGLTLDKLRPVSFVASISPAPIT